MTKTNTLGLPTYQPHGPIHLRVLCIDDNPDAADSEAMLLEMFGCTVAIAYSGQMGIQLVQSFKPDVCLVDFNMPLIDGFEVARWIKTSSSSHSVYLVAITGNRSQEIREKSKAAGFDVHLTKPFDWIELYGILHEYKASARRSPVPSDNTGTS